MHVMAAGARATAPAVFRTRHADVHGQWITLTASQLIGGDDNQIAVAIEHASGHQLLGLMLAAYALTPREREICDQVIDGHPTTAIARNLGISVHTVQDHLKSILDKTTARSRGELVARLQPDPPCPTDDGRPTNSAAAPGRPWQQPALDRVHLGCDAGVQPSEDVRRMPQERQDPNALVACMCGRRGFLGERSRVRASSLLP